jgi:tol-pal system protein YbgF
VTEETAPGPDALYQQALDALRAKQYSAARAGFEQVFQRAPEHHLSDNALYWLGEVEYDQKRFDLAAPAFERVMRDTPQGNKVPDAKVKLALCLLQLGQADKARILLREVAANYPGTEAAKVAAERLPAM